MVGSPSMLNAISVLVSHHVVALVKTEVSHSFTLLQHIPSMHHASVTHQHWGSVIVNAKSDSYSSHRQTDHFDVQTT